MSKASHSDELVTRINHPDINCEVFFDPSGMQISLTNHNTVYVKRRLRTLIEGIGDYLTRVVGSVPIDLKITLRVYHEPVYGSPGVVTVGPLYYNL